MNNCCGKHWSMFWTILKSPLKNHDITINSILKLTKKTLKASTPHGFLQPIPAEGVNVTSHLASLVCGHYGYYVRSIDIQRWFIDCLTIWTIWLFDYSTSSIILLGLSGERQPKISNHRGTPKRVLASRLQNQKKPRSVAIMACSKKNPNPQTPILLSYP